MRKAGAVSVSGAVLLALLCIALVPLLSAPVEGQEQGGDLRGQPATIQDTAPADGTPNRITIPFPAGQTCSVDEPTAQITVSDGETPPVSAVFANGAEATIAEAQNQVTITGPQGANLTVPTGFEADGEGTVENSVGITCTTAAPPTTAEPPAAPACPAGTTNVDTFTSDDTAFGPFRVSVEDFQVLYAVEEDEDQAAGGESFSVAVRRGGDTVSQSAAVTTAPADGTVEVNGEGPGTFRLDVNDQGVVFSITVCEGTDVASGGGGGGGGGGDLNCDDFDSQADAQAEFDADTRDPNNLDADDDGEACEDFPFGNVIDDDDDDDDDKLVNTGGPPLTLLGAICLAVASLALVRTVRRG